MNMSDIMEILKELDLSNPNVKGILIIIFTIGFLFYGYINMLYYTIDRRITVIENIIDLRQRKITDYYKEI